MKYVLKEMSIGEVLDVGINISKDNFKELFKIALCLMLPVNLFMQLLLVWVIPDSPGFFAPIEQQQAHQQQMFKNFQEFGPILGLAVLATFIFTPLTYAAIIRSIAGTYLGRSTSTAEAIRSGLGVVIPYVFIHLTTSFLVFACFFCGVIPGAVLRSIPLIFLGFFAACAPAIYLATRLYLAPYCLIIEGVSFASSFGRGWSLMKGNVINGFVLGMVVTLAVVCTNGMAGLIPQRHLAAVINAFIATATVVGACAISVVFYFSCRCKHENFDLSILANAVQHDSPGAASNDAAGPGGSAAQG